MRIQSNMETIMGMKSFLKQNMRSEGKSVEQIRQEDLAAHSQDSLLTGTTIEKVRIADLNAEWVIADEVDDDNETMIVYMHGGSFITGSCDTFRDLAARISKASGVRVLVFEYRLAPEHPYPAANDDCLAVYRWLRKEGHLAKHMIIGGDSIGGYLALMTLLSLRDAGEELPAAAFLLSPHTDFYYYDGESYVSRAELDPMGTLEGARTCANYYFNPSINDPAILSPLHQDLTGLPSLFIQVGDHEVIRSDSTQLAKRSQEAGVDVTLEVWDHMWHIFRFMASMLPDGDQAIQSIGQFVRKHVKEG
ncbi:Monoterpene epsilon-lactone hydrolase [compost metagenome]